MNSFEETTDYLYKRLPYFQKQGSLALFPHLENIQVFCQYLGNPESKFRSVHIGGTNGKGSCSYWIAACLQKSGYKVGTYTSPHIKCYTERIKINQTPIAKGFIVEFVREHKNFIEQRQLSFFEFSVGLAFHYFSICRVDVAVIEVGLGGRWDSTNVIAPLVSLITNISYDHTAILGNSIAEIAFEKAGIIKPTTPVVIGERQKEAEEVFVKTAKEQEAPLYFAQDYFTLQKTDTEAIILKDKRRAKKYELKWRLSEFQKANIVSCLQVLSILEKQFPKYSIHHFIDILENEAYQISGRWERLKNAPKIFCDVAHNAAAIKMIVSEIRKQDFKKLHLILSFSKDKNLKDIFELLPKEATYYFCHPKESMRAYSAAELASHAKKLKLCGKSYLSIAEAVQAALDVAEDEDLLFIGGSHFIIAEIPKL